jgi:hypothetical protein
MKRKLIYLTCIGLICYAYYYSLKNYCALEKKHIAFKEFGIIVFEDIYADTIDLSLYTSQGRLKYNVKHN